MDTAAAWFYLGFLGLVLLAWVGLAYLLERGESR